MYTNTYSNRRFSGVPLTAERDAVVDFVAFESETAVVYPFAVEFDDMTMEMVDSICSACNGHTDDADSLYDACEKVLGVNPAVVLMK